MFHPKTQYAKIAFDTILFYKTTGQIRKTDESKITPDLKLNLGCIVYIYDSNDTLISYFGNVYPQKPSLYEEIVSNAVIAADSTKNGQLTERSMEQINVFVDVLSLPHKVDNIQELNPQKQGLFIKDKNGKTGFVLPNQKGIKTGTDQLKLAKKQAGLEKKNDSEIEIMSFKVTRYD
jgi:AMMECR1 domain-containing protein